MSEQEQNPEHGQENAAGTIKILYINNYGGGFADQIAVPAGMTIAQFFASRTEMENQVPRDFLIRVNRQATSQDQVLQEGDRVTITPAKIAGA